MSLPALAVAAAAFALRAAFLVQARAVPSFGVLLSDSRAYVEWSRAIAAGDWLSRSVGVFYQAPLYPYLLAAIRRLAGESLEPVRWLQAGLGAAACGLIVVAGARWFGRPAGIAAGALAALHAPAIFFDGLIHKESLGFLLMALLLVALARALGAAPPGSGAAPPPAEPPPARSWLAVGAVLGLLCLVRENALLLALPLGAWPVLAHRGTAAAVSGSGWTRRRRLAALAALAAGLAAVLGPVALRNLAVGGEAALTTAQAGPNFYIGNRIGATGSYTPLRRGRSDTPQERADARGLAARALGRPLTAGEVSRYWFGRALDDIRRRPARWLRLLAVKARLAFHAYEVPDVEDFYVYRRVSPVLRAAGLVGHMGVLAPLAAAGLVLSWPRRRELWPLYGCVAALAAGLVAFYVLARYRFPLVPLLALFAGAALAEGWRAARRGLAGRGRRLAVAAVAAAAVALAVDLPIAAQRAGGRALALSNQGAALVGAERYAEAAELYRRALAADPDLAEARMNLGSLLLVGGRAAEAVPHLRRAAELVPDDAEVAEQLGVALARAGDPAAGAAELERAVALEPAAPRPWRNLAAVYLQAGRQREAREAVERGLAAVPGDPGLEAQRATLAGGPE